jgi:hypothetical protein
VPLQSEPQQLVIETHTRPPHPEHTEMYPVKAVGSANGWSEGIHVFPSIPRHDQSQVRVTSEFIAETLDNASHGVWFLSAEDQVIVHALVYLTSTIRSQSFSLSQRFDPTWAVWFYFTPHPPLGFPAFRAFPSQSAVVPFGTPYSPVVEPAPAHLRKPEWCFHRRFQPPRLIFASPAGCPSFFCTTS